MPEGLLGDDGAVGGAVYDDPDHAPEPSAEAPRGWTWARKDKRWAPRQRGPVLWQVGTPSGAADAPDDSGHETGAEGQHRDPDPSWLRDDSKKDSKGSDRPRFDPRSVSQETRDEIGSILGLIAVVLVSPIERADPVCGGALADSADKIIAKMIPLICRSERVVGWLSADGGGVLDWLGLAIALAPVIGAVFAHHVVHSVEVVEEQDEQTGKVVKIVQPVDYSQYAAA